MTLPKIIVVVLVFGATACIVDDTNVRGPGNSYTLVPQQLNPYGSPRSMAIFEYPDTTGSQTTVQEDTNQTTDVSGLQLDLGSL